MNEQELQSEILSTDDAKIREMCGSLKRVSAPKNFDMRLKARIAAHNPQGQRKPFFTFLKVAAPLGLTVAFLGAVVSTNFTADEKINPQIAANYEVTPKSPENSTAANETNTLVIAKNNGPNANFETDTPRKVNVNINEALATTRPSDLGKLYPKNSLTNNTNGGSRIDAVSTPPLFTRENANKNLVEKKSSDTNTENISSGVRKGFDSVGIKAVSLGNRWVVQSVVKDSLAERSEILPYDVIETVDGVNFPEIKDFKINSGTKLTLVRDNKRMVVTLK